MKVNDIGSQHTDYSIGVELNISVRHIICDCCEHSHLDLQDHL